MSDTWLIIVPLDPYAAPDDEAVEAARVAVVEGLPDAEEVTVESSRNPQFIDAGQNFENVSCAACGTSLDEWWPQAMAQASGIEESWTEAMDKANERGFQSLLVVTPCCGNKTTLNDLNYDWPQAFARVSIHAMNPGVTELAPGVKDEVERRLGLSSRIIWQHI